MKLRILLLTCMLSAIACIARANDDNRGNGLQLDLSGGVVDAETGKPLTNVNVTVMSQDNKTKWVTTTDQNGNYSFNNIKGGNYKLVFQKDGFKKVIKEKIFIKEDENKQLSTEMAPGTDFQIIPGLLLFEHFEDED